MPRTSASQRPPATTIGTTMSVKDEEGVSNNPAAARIRENQRRSRARRKEYVEGMEKRLAELERRGVEATLDMQQAARAVALENSRLRILLQRQGINAGEVDEFLGSFQGTEMQTSDGHSAQGDWKPILDRQPRELSDPLSILAAASMSESCSGGNSTCAASSTSQQSDLASPGSSRTTTMPTTPSPSWQHSLQEPHLSHSESDLGSPMLMSCNTAAQIIAQMQGTNNTNHYKSKMGCKDECECLVKNTLLFQIMDGQSSV